MFHLILKTNMKIFFLNILDIYDRMILGSGSNDPINNWSSLGPLMEKLLGEYNFKHLSGFNLFTFIYPLELDLKFKD